MNNNRLDASSTDPQINPLGNISPAEIKKYAPTPDDYFSLMEQVTNANPEMEGRALPDRDEDQAEIQPITPGLQRVPRPAIAQGSRKTQVLHLSRSVAGIHPGLLRILRLHLQHQRCSMLSGDLLS